MYAALTLAIAVLGGVVGSAMVGGEGASGVWFAALLAYVIQLVAFGFLLGTRSDARLFMMGWLGGMVLRMVVVGGLAIWVTRTEAFSPAPTLVSLVVLVFVMLLLEPVFLKRGRTTA